MMLVSKIKVGTAMFLVTCALAVGGTGLAYRAQADETPADPARVSGPIGGPGQAGEPGQEEELQRSTDQKKEELRRLIAEASREGGPSPSDQPDRIGTKAARVDGVAERRLGEWNERVTVIRARFNKAEEEVRVADTNRRKAEAELEIARENLLEARSALEDAEQARADSEAEAYAARSAN